jgi:hypothetical protein
MIGTLYRYPHPHDPTRFIYVGQGPNRDAQHRSGKSSFGRRFKKIFPGVELPHSVREQIEVTDYVALNEEETIWMFWYHTWRGYLDGMNLVLPGSLDYKNMGKLGGGGCFRQHPNLARENGYKVLERKVGIFAPDFDHSVGGKKGGIKNVETGHIQALGRKAVDSGQLAGITTFETCSKGGKAGGRIGGKIGGKVAGRHRAESGHCAKIATLGGSANAILRRKEALKRYDDSPSICKWCLKIIVVLDGQSVPNIKKKKFCSSYCRKNGHIKTKG